MCMQTYHMVQGEYCCKDSFDGVLPPDWLKNFPDHGPVECPEYYRGGAPSKVAGGAQCRNHSLDDAHGYLVDRDTGHPVSMSDLFVPRGGVPNGLPNDEGGFRCAT